MSLPKSHLVTQCTTEVPNYRLRSPDDAQSDRTLRHEPDFLMPVSSCLRDPRSIRGRRFDGQNQLLAASFFLLSPRSLPLSDHGGPWRVQRLEWAADAWAPGEQSPP